MRIYVYDVLQAHDTGDGCVFDANVTFTVRIDVADGKFEIMITPVGDGITVRERDGRRLVVMPDVANVVEIGARR